MKWGVIVFLFAFNSAAGQFYFYDDKYLDQPVLVDIGVNLGMMNCLTDLGQGNKSKKGFEGVAMNCCPEFGAFLGIKWNQRYGLRLHMNYGTVTASDSVLKNTGGDAVYRYQRNLHFRSRILEATVLGILYPAGFFEYESPPKAAPYLLFGLGLFHFDPQAFLLDTWTSLAPLRTEGIEPSTYYNRWQSNLVTGFGGSYEVNARLSTMIEFSYRFLHTDYLDDVSNTFINPEIGNRTEEQSKQLQALYALSRVRPGTEVSKPGSIRGNPSNKDRYFSLRVAICWTINRERIH